VSYKEAFTSRGIVLSLSSRTKRQCPVSYKPGQPGGGQKKIRVRSFLTGTCSAAASCTATCSTLFYPSLGRLRLRLPQLKGGQLMAQIKCTPRTTAGQRASRAHCVHDTWKPRIVCTCSLSGLRRFLRRRAISFTLILAVCTLIFFPCMIIFCLWERSKIAYNICANYGRCPRLSSVTTM
jgi:hypothetical protein